MENAAIAVIMKTGIVGADPVIISQPVLHGEHQTDYCCIQVLVRILF